MNTERFSADKFEKAGIDSKEARALVNQLASELGNELQVLVRNYLTEKINELNKIGHGLTLFAEDELEDGHFGISFRDYTETECRLRLGVDVVISAGYPHLVATTE